MPRLVDPTSKTPQLTVRAVNDKDKENFRKLKEICKEKGVTLASVIRPWLNQYVEEHWPPNPQLQIQQFTGQLPFSHETLRKLPLATQHFETCPLCNGEGCRFCKNGKVVVDKV